jgi:hypothetical protein
MPRMTCPRLPRSETSPLPPPSSAAPRAGACFLTAAAALVCALVWTQAERPAQAAATVPSSRHEVQPNKDALALVEQVRARWMGVDRAGNLWAWEALEGSVRFFSPAAERLPTIVVPLDASAVDGDAQWGAVALTPLIGPGGVGRVLAWVRPGGAPGKHEEVVLPEPASWVCWIDQDTVALSPQRAPHRVEMWSLRQRKLVSSLGSEPVIKLATGATRVREVQLRYDAARRLLFTLETFTGDLEVFSHDGKVVWRAKLDDPYRKVEEKTLASLDERAKSHNMELGQTLSDLWLAEGPDGTAWVSQEIDMFNKAVGLIKASAAGTTVEKASNLRCPSKTFTIWGTHLVFFRDIASPREVCNDVVPLPEQK